MSNDASPTCPVADTSPAQPRGSALWKVNFTLSCDGTIIIWNQLFGVKICIDVEFKLGHHLKPLALLSWLLHGSSAALLAGGVARRVPSLSCRRLWIGRGCSAALRRGKRCPSAVHTVAAPHTVPSASLRGPVGEAGGDRGLSEAARALGPSSSPHCACRGPRAGAQGRARPARLCAARPPFPLSRVDGFIPFNRRHLPF